ncbi:MAG: hypothetical protein IKC70_05455 [Bacteroidaceae bacterium]|nr:hypothetical protein [Bacteroidaceae bacterium]
MMDFITIPLIFGIVTLGIYKLFELFVCKKERLIILEKMNFDNANNQSVNNLFKRHNSPLPFSFSALKVGCLLLGLGLGIVLGILFFAFNIETVRAFGDLGHYNTYYAVSLIISGFVLLMGGAGLLLAILIEYKCSKKKD